MKAVFPDAKVIVHLDQGNDRRRYDRMFGLLEANGGKYDMIGMSLYPYWVQEGGDKRGWLEITEDCIANVDYVTKRYGKPGDDMRDWRALEQRRAVQSYD